MWRPSTPDVCLNTSLVTLLGSSVQLEVYCLMWGSFLSVEVLDESRVGIEIRSSRVPVRIA